MGLHRLPHMEDWPVSGGGPGRPASAPSGKPGDEAPPEAAQTAENVCRACRGTGLAQDGPCPECGGTGTVTETVGDA